MGAAAQWNNGGSELGLATWITSQPSPQDSSLRFFESLYTTGPLFFSCQRFRPLQTGFQDALRLGAVRRCGSDPGIQDVGRGSSVRVWAPDAVVT